MTLNLGKQIEHKISSLAMTQDFMNKNKITVNEPTQTHFSVEGVQAYSPAEIQALKKRGERVSNTAQKDGEYIKPTAYKIDDQIDFGADVDIQNKQLKGTLQQKAKSSVKLQAAKPITANAGSRTKPKVLKPSIRNELGRANQQIVKMGKQFQKKQLLQQKMEELTKKYKQHFGDQIKSNNKKKQFQQNKKVNEQQENSDNEEIVCEEQAGEQMLPNQKYKIDQSMITKTKGATLKNDDSFEQVQWEQSCNTSMRSSKMNKSTYSEKLGNAVHLLFD